LEIQRFSKGLVFGGKRVKNEKNNNPNSRKAKKKLLQWSRMQTNE